MQTPLTVLHTVTIPTDCHVSWDSMRGDERTRHCSTCNQTVFNLSSMTASEAAELLTSNGYNVCIRLYRRPDGSVVTRDCEEALSTRKPQMVRRVVAALAAWLGITLVSGCFKCCQGAPAPPTGAGQVQARTEDK